jgi:hypothetical protein
MSLMLLQYPVGNGGSRGAATLTGSSSPTLHVDDASDGFMGDSVVRCDVAKRFMSRSLLNLRPDLWRKPIPSDSTGESGFRENCVHREIGRNVRRCLG